MLAAFFACVVVAVLFVRATCPGPVVYLRSAEVADASARRGITPEMTEQAFDDQCTGANPRYPLMSEIREMYLNAYYGRKQAVK